MTHDLMTALDTLRPDAAALDEDWSRATLGTIMAASTRPKRKPRRVGTVLAGTVGVGLLGVGAAAAAGLSPQNFTDAFSGWRTVSPESEPGRQAVDPADARRVATGTGPGDTVFSLLVAPGQGDFSCVAVLFETRLSAAAPTPTDFVDANGSSCAAAPPADARFGEMAALDVQRLPAALGEEDVRVLSISAGEAERAEVLTPEGERISMLRFDGRFYGWFVGDGDATPRVLLVGFAADGTEVGRTRL